MNLTRIFLIGKPVSSALTLALLLALSIVQTAKAASWITNSPLITGRFGHAAILLTNGHVLVVGGSVTSGDTASAELFNPATGVWSNINAMQDARLAPTASLLTNGNVLVTGGQGQTGNLSSTELYNPGTGTWEPNGALNSGRHGHTATLLPDGRVLVAGGYAGLNSSGTELASAELYDPVTRVWSTTGPLTGSRLAHTATLLPTGRVLVIGGVQSNSLSSSAELYDPDLGTWTPINSMTFARRQHTATLLPGGQVLVAGGFGNTNNISVAELYDPSTSTWTNTGALNFPRNSHTATLMPSGEVLVAGGDGFPSGWGSSTELYNPVMGIWTNAGVLHTARGYHTATLLPSGKVLVAGGFGEGSHLTSTESYVEAVRFNLIHSTILPDGGFQFGFTNVSGIGFSVLATTNLSLPLGNWTVLGGVTEISPGQFQFTDMQTTNNRLRFYRVRAN